MPTGLTVMVDGQPVPLDDCGWFERRACGCLVSALVAVHGDEVIATADQASRHWHRTKREREQVAREGITVELITMAHYRDHIGANWECEQHTKSKAPQR